MWCCGFGGGRSDRDEARRVGDKRDKGADAHELNDSDASRTEKGRVVGLLLMIGVEEVLPQLGRDVHLLRRVRQDEPLQDVLKLGFEGVEPNLLFVVERRVLLGKPKGLIADGDGRVGVVRGVTKVEAGGLGVVCHGHVESEVLSAVRLFEIVCKFTETEWGGRLVLQYQFKSQTIPRWANSSILIRLMAEMPWGFIGERHHTPAKTRS